MKNNNKNINNEIWSFRWCRDGHVRVGPTLISPYQQHKTEFLCSQISRHLLKNIASLIRLGRTHHTLTNIHSLVRQFLPIGPQHHSRHLRPCHPWFPHRSARHRTGIRSRIRRIERGLHNWIQRKRNAPRLGIIGPTLLAPQWSCWSFFCDTSINSRRWRCTPRCIPSSATYTRRPRVCAHSNKLREAWKYSLATSGQLSRRTGAYRRPTGSAHTLWGCSFERFVMLRPRREACVREEEAKSHGKD